MIYLHIGNQKVMKADELLAILDIDNFTQSDDGAAFLENCEKENRLENIGNPYDLPKSVILRLEGPVQTGKKEKKKATAYLSPITTQTLKKR